MWSRMKQGQYEAKVEENKDNMKVDENKGNMMLEAVAGKGGKNLRCTFLPLIWEDVAFYKRRLKSANQCMVIAPMLTIPSQRWQVEKGDVELNESFKSFGKVRFCSKNQSKTRKREPKVKIGVCTIFLSQKYYSVFSKQNLAAWQYSIEFHHSQVVIRGCQVYTVSALRCQAGS